MKAPPAGGNLLWMLGMRVSGQLCRAQHAQVPPQSIRKRADMSLKPCCVKSHKRDTRRQMSNVKVIGSKVAMAMKKWN